jgi:hypothetical protein
MRMRRLSVFIVALCTGCTSIACKPVLVIHTWKPLYGVPVEESGQPTVRERLDDIESISFVQCSYND